MKHYKLSSQTAAVLAGLALVLTFALSSEKAVAGPPAPIIIVLDNYITSLTSEGGTEAGVLTSTGALALAGLNTMEFRIIAETLHCQVLFADDVGTFTISMQCQMVMTSEMTGGGPGRWVITHGTGAYKNLHGTGALTMEFNLGVFPPIAVETLEGYAVFDNRP